MKRVHNFKWIVPVILLMSLALVGFTDNSSDFGSNMVEGRQSTQSVGIDMDEWSLTPEDFTFQAGETVVFDIINSGRFPHAIEISDNSQHLHSPTIAGGATTTLEVTFEHGGEYTYICPIPGHAALGMVGTLTVEGADPAPDTGEFLGTTLMRLSPRNGTEVEGNSQDVRLSLHDFTLNADAIGSANVAGEGHWALFLDDVLVDSLGEPSFTLEGLSPGDHTIRAELRNNDGTPVDPALGGSATITVPAPMPVLISAPEPEPPSVGEPSLIQAAGIGLALGIVFVVGGGAALIMNRRRQAV